METNDMDTFCRLCLSEGGDLMNVFESKGIKGWTAADAITELLRIQVSAEDVYPKSLCFDCMGKLADFKVFKDRCESSKQLMDRSYAVKHGIGRNEGAIRSSVTCDDSDDDNLSCVSEWEIQSDITASESDEKKFTAECEAKNQVLNDFIKKLISVGAVKIISPEEIPAVEPKVESDVSPPFTMTVDNSRVPNEEQLASNGDEEIDPLGDLSDVKPSVSELNNMLSGVKGEPYEGVSDNECPEEVFTLSRTGGSDGVSRVKEECSDVGEHVFDVSTAEMRSADNGPTSSGSDCSESHPALPQQHTTTHELTATRLAEPTRCETNRRSVRVHRTRNEDSTGSSSTTTGTIDHRVSSSPRTPIEGDRRIKGLDIISNHSNPKGVDLGAGKYGSEGEVTPREQSGDEPNISSYTRVLRSRKRKGGTLGSDGGVCVESRVRWKKDNITKERRLDENSNKFKCDSCEFSFASKSNLRKHMESHVGREMVTSEVHSTEVLSSGGTPVGSGRKSASGAKDSQQDGSNNDWECDICRKKLKAKWKLKVHRMIHDERQFKCAHCEKAFCYMGQLRRHIKMHVRIYNTWNERRAEKRARDSKGKTARFECDICWKTFRDNGRLNCHKSTHEGQKPFECLICGEKFRHSAELTAHKRTHTEENPFKCKECDRAFGIKSSLTSHMATHNSEGTFRCTECPKKFGYKNSLTKHMLTHSGEKAFGCDICGKEFFDRSSLKPHLMTHSKERPFKCKICTKGFCTSNSLKEHNKVHSGERPFQCTVCEKRFYTKSALDRHLTIHTGEKPFECRLCGERFRYSHALKHHQTVHTGIKPFECTTCGKRFVAKHVLVSHITTHSKEKPFGCDFCEARLRNKHSLRMHMMVHTGEKPYECGTCQRRFTQSITLKRHLRTHSGEKPFECGICKRRFGHSNTLKAHQLMHAGEKMFRCATCNKQFSQKSALVTHVRKHTGEQPFGCKFCERRFKHNVSLRRHEMTHST